MTPFHKTVDLTKDIEYEKETGVKIIRLDPLVKISSRLILKKLNKTIKSINPDVVFMHGIGDFKDLQLWKNKSEYKIIRDCHMSWVASKNRFNKFFYKVFSVFFAPIINNSSKYEVVYALGDEEYEYLRRIGIKDSKIDYLKHGYDDSVMFFNENDLSIKFIGSLTREEVFDFYAKSTLIFPSYIETVGLPLLEAKMHWTPIIASDSAFSHEILDGYDKVEFFESFDYRHLSSKMKNSELNT